MAAEEAQKEVGIVLGGFVCLARNVNFAFLHIM